MDGFGKKMKRSMRFMLISALMIVIVIFSAIASIGTYIAMQHEYYEIQDNHLKEVALLLNYYLPDNHINTNSYLGKNQHNDDLENSYAIAILGQPISENSNPLSHIDPTTKTGFHDIKINDNWWRVYIYQLNNDTRIALGQESELRSDLAKHSAYIALYPLVLIFPLLILIVILIINRTLKPIDLLTQDLKARKNEDISPLKTRSLPSEIAPFVHAINHQLEKINSLMAEQNRFIADAAHELRSPLTALSLHVQNIGSHPSADDMTYLKRIVDRARNLLEQLMTLAKSQVHADYTGSSQAVSVVQAFNEVLELVYPLAEAKNIDIGVISTENCVLHINPFDLSIVLRNLCDNAIRYTPANGQVDLNTYSEKNHIIIEVKDNGIGLDEQALSEVFQPFYRVLGSKTEGSGLGLAIAKSIVSKYNGKIEVKNNTEQNGCCFKLSFETNS